MKILLLTGEGLRCDILYGHLDRNYNIVGVVVDKTYSVKAARIKKIKKRIKKYGFIKVIQQIIFTRIIIPFLKMESKNRMLNLLKDVRLKQPSSHFNTIKTENINSEKVLDFIVKNNPDLIIVHSTTIIKEKLLSVLHNKPIINFHIGITPNYRGLFGGYWAIYNGDKSNFGSTVHFLDEGIDTGKIISQKRISTTKDDNYYTYQFLQTIEGLGCIDDAINTISKGLNIGVVESPGKTGKFYTQPTVSQYLYKRLVYGVK